jgi:hypothetical protein
MIAMAKQQIMGLREFQKHFNDEKACREHLFRLGKEYAFIIPMIFLPDVLFLTRTSLLGVL